MVAETALIWLLGDVGAYAFWRVAMRLGGAAADAWAGPGAFVFGFAVLPLAYETLVRRTGLKAVGLWAHWDKGRSALRTGAACAALIAWAWATIALLHRGAAPWASVRLAGLMTGPALVAALSEETLFRAVVQRRLSRVLGLWPALVVAAGLYAFVGHPRAPFLDNLVLRLPAGCVFGFVYWRERSLPAAMACHFVADLLVAVPR